MKAAPPTSVRRASEQSFAIRLGISFPLAENVGQDDGILSHEFSSFQGEFLEPVNDSMNVSFHRVLWRAIRACLSFADSFSPNGRRIAMSAAGLGVQ